MDNEDQVDEFVAVEVIENTAARLGVDPVALAEVCRDGELLTNALYPLLAWPDKVHPYGIEISDKLAALKRQEG